MPTFIFKTCHLRPTIIQFWGSPNQPPSKKSKRPTKSSPSNGILTKISKTKRKLQKNSERYQKPTKFCLMSRNERNMTYMGLMDRKYRPQNSNIPMLTISSNNFSGLISHFILSSSHLLQALQELQVIHLTDMLILEPATLLRSLRNRLNLHTRHRTEQQQVQKKMRIKILLKVNNCLQKDRYLKQCIMLPRNIRNCFFFTQRWNLKDNKTDN